MKSVDTSFCAVSLLGTIRAEDRVQHKFPYSCATLIENFDMRHPTKWPTLIPTELLTASVRRKPSLLWLHAFHARRCLAHLCQVTTVSDHIFLFAKSCEREQSIGTYLESPSRLLMQKVQKHGLMLQRDIDQYCSHVSSDLAQKHRVMQLTNIDRYYVMSQKRECLCLR